MHYMSKMFAHTYEDNLRLNSFSSIILKSTYINEKKR